jgi:hypothetical protein
MACFRPDEQSWRRIDYAAIAGRGVACVADDEAAACRRWLEAHGYRLVALDCTGGWPAVAARLGALFSWREQLGYDFTGHSLDALADGFAVAVPADGGTVLWLEAFEALWRDDGRRALGLLDIAAAHSRVHIAAGRRFFTIVLLAPGSPAIGACFGQHAIPGPWRSRTGWVVET